MAVEFKKTQLTKKAKIEYKESKIKNDINYQIIVERYDILRDILQNPLWKKILKNKEQLFEKIKFMQTSLVLQSKLDWKNILFDKMQYFNEEEGLLIPENVVDLAFKSKQLFLFIDRLIEGKYWFSKFDQYLNDLIKQQKFGSTLSEEILKDFIVSNDTVIKYSTDIIEALALNLADLNQIITNYILYEDMEKNSKIKSNHKKK